MEQNDNDGNAKPKRHQATVYDAVAGRVGYEGFLSSSQQPTRYRDTNSKSTKPVPPEEVLFRRKGAPIRYEEDDLYFADRKLGAHQKLPDSDLLKALHTYVADYYAATSGSDVEHDHYSLDETALLAMGILVEEAVSEMLGKSGDLALAQGVEDDPLTQDSDQRTYLDGKSRKRSVIAEASLRPKTRRKSARVGFGSSAPSEPG